MKILVAVLALGLAFWGYAFVYRGKTEPPAKYPVTNQDAAVYSLRGQIQMLSQQEELNTFAFEGRKKEKEYGTYIIPGYKNIPECRGYKTGGMYFHDSSGTCSDR